MKLDPSDTSFAQENCVIFPAGSRVSRAFEEFDSDLKAGVQPVLSEYYRYKNNTKIKYRDCVMHVEWN